MDGSILEAFQIIASILVGSGGVLGTVSLYRARRSKRMGIPKDEHLARRRVELGNLNEYWLSELKQARKERALEVISLRTEIDALRALRHADAEYIDMLEEHIYMKRPPPPPKRQTMPQSTQRNDEP